MWMVITNLKIYKKINLKKSDNFYLWEFWLEVFTIILQTQPGFKGKL